MAIPLLTADVETIDAVGGHARAASSSLEPSGRPEDGVVDQGPYDGWANAEGPWPSWIATTR